MSDFGTNHEKVILEFVLLIFAELNSTSLTSLWRDFAPSMESIRSLVPEIHETRPDVRKDIS